MLKLETERLIIRHFNVDDAAFILRLLNTPGWLRFIGDRHVQTVEQARTYLLTGPISSYEKTGFGLYLVSLKKEGTSLGMCGLVKRKTMEDPELGFAFLPEHTGNGFAFESAVVVLQYAKNTLKVPKIVATTLPENKNSIRLLEKTGFRFDKKIRLPGETEALMLFVQNVQGSAL